MIYKYKILIIKYLIKLIHIMICSLVIKIVIFKIIIDVELMWCIFFYY